MNIYFLIHRTPTGFAKQFATYLRLSLSLTKLGKQVTLTSGDEWQRRTQTPCCCSMDIPRSCTSSVRRCRCRNERCKHVAPDRTVAREKGLGGRACIHAQLIAEASPDPKGAYLRRGWRIEAIAWRSQSEVVALVSGDASAHHDAPAATTGKILITYPCRIQFNGHLGGEWVLRRQLGIGRIGARQDIVLRRR